MILEKFIDVMRRLKKIGLAEMPKIRKDLSISQMATIRQIITNPGSRLQHIAESVGVTAPSMSVALKKLEEGGWIYRKDDPEDKRASCFYPDKKSEKLFVEVQNKQMLGLKNFLSTLSGDEQEQLVSLLDKAIGKLENKNRDKERM